MVIKKRYKTLCLTILMLCTMYWCATSCFAWPRGERREEKHWLIVNFIPRQYTYIEILQNKELFDIYCTNLKTSGEKRKARWDYESLHGR